jgi:hypothetical protein
VFCGTAARARRAAFWNAVISINNFLYYVYIYIPPGSPGSPGLSRALQALGSGLSGLSRALSGLSRALGPGSPGVSARSFYPGLSIFLTEVTAGPAQSPPPRRSAPALAQRTGGNLLFWVPPCRRAKWGSRSPPTTPRAYLCSVEGPSVPAGIHFLDVAPQRWCELILLCWPAAGTSAASAVPSQHLGVSYAVVLPLWLHVRCWWSTAAAELCCLLGVSNSVVVLFLCLASFFLLYTPV